MQISKILKLSSILLVFYSSTLLAQTASFKATELSSLSPNSEYYFYNSLIDYYAENGNSSLALNILNKEVLNSSFITEENINTGIELSRLESSNSEQIDIALLGIKKFGWRKDWYYTIGNAHYEQDRFSTSESYFLEIYRKDDAHLPTLIRLGDIANQDENFQKAVEYYGKAFAILPDNSRLKRSYGIALSKTGKLKEGITLLEEIKQKDPKDVTTLYYLAILYRNTGKQSEACKQMQQVSILSNQKFGKAELRKWDCR